MAAKKLTTESEIFQAAIDLLSRRDYAAGELKQKLLTKTSPAERESSEDNVFDGPVEPQVSPRELVERVVIRVQEAGYQSDERYIEMLVRARKERGYGPQFIAQYLQQYKLDSLLVEEYIDSRDPEWKEYALRQLEKKYRQPSDDFKERQKQQRHLYQRGFNSDQIRWAMSRFDEMFEE